MKPNLQGLFQVFIIFKVFSVAFLLKVVSERISQPYASHIHTQPHAYFSVFSTRHESHSHDCMHIKPIISRPNKGQYYKPLNSPYYKGSSLEGSAAITRSRFVYIDFQSSVQPICLVVCNKESKTSW